MINQAHKTVHKPGKKLQLVIARGVITRWNMPCYFGIDTPMTLPLLWRIVADLEGKGFRVWGTSFDLGNQEFKRDTGLLSGVYKLRNPSAPDRWFYLNPDAPHELKRLRDNCFSKQFLFPKDPFSKKYAPPTKRNIDFLVESGDYVALGKSHFQELLEQDSGEFKIHWKLKPSHLNVENSGRCSVRVAVQTLSASSALAMELVRPEWKTQAAVVRAVNDVSIFKINLKAI